MIKSADEFVNLRSSENKSDYARAVNESASEQVWIDVIQQFPDMIRWVIQNKTVPLTILELLANSDQAEIRFWVAMKRKLSDELFLKLSKDQEEDVRLRIAINKKTPVDILRNLSTDHSEIVAQQAIEKLQTRL